MQTRQLFFFYHDCELPVFQTLIDSAWFMNSKTFPWLLIGCSRGGRSEVRVIVEALHVTCGGSALTTLRCTVFSREHRVREGRICSAVRYLMENLSEVAIKRLLHQINDELEWIWRFRGKALEQLTFVCQSVWVSVSNQKINAYSGWIVNLLS